jgi:hypothetical protein
MKGLDPLSIMKREAFFSFFSLSSRHSYCNGLDTQLVPSKLVFVAPQSILWEINLPIFPNQSNIN